MLPSNVQYEKIGTWSKQLVKCRKIQIKWYSFTVKFWIFAVVLAGLMLLVNYFELRTILFDSMKEIEEINRLSVDLPSNLDGYLINTPGCRIPEMDPFDPSVKKFIKKPPKLNCDRHDTPVFDISANSIKMSQNETNKLNCCFEAFQRLEPDNDSYDNTVKYSGKCEPIHEQEIFPEDEFIKVTCTNSKGKEVYQDFFSFVPVKNDISASTESLKPNILIVGIDAVSRVNLHRQLPKTYKYLMEDLHSVELLGYNKVADNTFPNLMPVFTGLSEQEINETCNLNFDDHFDKCPFVWKDFADLGYITAIGEDCAAIGLFNYLKKGFQKQPTNYYYTSFSGEIEKRIGHDKDFNCFQCVGNRESYRLLLDYIDKFTLSMKKQMKPYFGFFWGNALSHDYLNRPYLGDPVYHNLLAKLKNDGRLNNTILIFMSDHGIRWGDIRQTYQGQMEERLPFIIMALPKLIEEKYPGAVRNLKKNVRRLTTPFDLHETLRYFLSFDDLNSTENQSDKLPRGYNLFSQIPNTRTCEDAQIESHWCTCQNSETANVTDPNVIQAAKFAVYHMNTLLSGYAECAPLFLHRIINARKLSHFTEHINAADYMTDYTITLETKPGGGIFEVTVRKKDEDTRNLTITGTISRLNMYGKQSVCITDFHLKLYCYCRNYLKIF